MYDVVIIGAGVVGCAIARELSAYKLKVCVLERASDVCEGTSKANSGIVHAGYDAKPGSKMAEFNVLGASMMPDICKELDVPYVHNGSFVLCFSKDDMPGLNKLLEQGKANGVSDLSIITGDEARALDSCISPDVFAALYAPTAGIVDPFLLTVAYAENAAENGVTFFFDKDVRSVAKSDDGYEVVCEEQSYQTKAVINAAGVFADVFYNQAVGKRRLHITPRRGSYLLLDRSAHPVPSHTLFQLPTKYGKGILVAPTCHGNTIVGPTAVDIDDKEGVNTTREEIQDVIQKARLSVPKLPLQQTITSFAGLRAHEDGHEFYIEETDGLYLHLVGIESPGLTSSPALASFVAQKMAQKLRAKPNAAFNPKRSSIPRFYDLSKDEQEALIKQSPAYGKIICRCEHITQGEIEEALKRDVPPRSLDGVKRRLRAGMGRCQGGFCSPLVMQLLAKTENFVSVRKANKQSQIVFSHTKEPLNDD